MTAFTARSAKAAEKLVKLGVVNMPPEDVASIINEYAKISDLENERDDLADKLAKALLVIRGMLEVNADGSAKALCQMVLVENGAI